MASDRSQVRPSWRPGASPSRPGASSGSGWRRIDPASSPRSAGFSRASRLLLGLVGAIAAYVAVVWIVLWLSPVRPAGVYRVGSGYEENLAVPHNVHGMNAMAAVARLGLPAGKARDWFSSPEGLGQVRPVVPLGPEPFRKGYLDEIRESTVLVYLTGQAGADARGAFVFQDHRDLLRLPADQIDSSGKVHLADIIENLKAVGSKNFCLILDVAIAPTNVPLGMIRNDFIARLNELKPEVVKARNLVVIAPASPGQRTWVSDGWRQTIFGHYVAEALAGLPADRRRVDSKGLFAYVKDRVPAWTRDHRGEAQTPIMLPEVDSALNLDLAAAPRDLPASPAEPETGPVPERWKRRWLGRWKAYSELKATHPEAHAPALWTDYRAWLLRHEALVRSLAPEEDDAGKPLVEIEKKLEALGRQIKSDRQFGPKRSVDASLAMRAAWDGPTGPDQVDFAKLWDPQQAEKLTINDRDRPAYYEKLLDRVESAIGPEDFARARAVLTKLNRGTHPVEAHALAILLQDMPPGAADSADYRALVKAALQGRRKAERVAVGLGSAPLAGLALAYAEQVAPLVAHASLDEADRDRRKAEDLLLAADPGRWKQAKKDLDAANQVYSRAEADASAWRDAVEARNRAFADLPYHGAWAVRQTLDESLSDQVVDAWKQAHAISLALDETSGRGPGAKGAIPDRPKLAELEKRFQDECDKRERIGIRVGDYDATLALLETPLLEDTGRREALLKKLVEKPVLAAPGSGPVAPIPIDKVADRQAQLALEAVGQSGPGGAGSPVAADGKADEAVKLVGEGTRIAGRYRAIRQAVEPLPRESDPNATDRTDRTDRLREIDEQARLLVAGQLEATEDPTLAYRRRLLQGLLLVQARRALDDHWYSENDEPESPVTLTYFRKSVDSFLDDFKRLSTDWADDPAFLKLKADLNRAARLVLEAPESPLIATDERALELSYRIEAPAGAPGMAGRPVVWLTLDGDPRVASTQPRRDVAIDDRDGSPPGRLGPGPASSRFSWPVNFAPLARAAEALGKARPTVSTGAARIDGRYRGQVLRQVTRTQVHPVPEIVALRKLPRPTGDVVVQADPAVIQKFGGVEAGALVIVLDCSRSMGAPLGQPEAGPSKYREATRAIGTILNRVTRGTKVSLWAFGQKDNSGAWTVGPNQTIRQILPPTSWEPKDEGMIAEVMNRINYPALQPWNTSPIVGTMLRAGADFSGVSGFKSMLVLTDGKDTSFEGRVAGPNQPKVDVADVLRQAFAGSDVEINVVGYKIAEREGESEDVVARQFRVIREFRRPGEFYPVRQAEGLADALAKALRPSLRYSVQSLGNVRISAEVTLGDDLSAQGGFKNLDPGGYQLVVDTGEYRSPQYLVVNQGDHLVVRLKERDGQVVPERVVWTEDPPLGVPSLPEGDWRLAALRSRRVGDGLSLRVALEKRVLRDETALQVIRPREVWMEAAEAGGSLFQQRWARLDAYPAPAWELTVPSWPEARPRLSAWWDPDQEAEPSATLPRADFRSLEEVRERAVPLDRGEEVAVIESVELEDLPADLVPAGPAWRGAKRLVVRASFPKGRRFWVKPQGFSTESAEHRFHTRANKYTGLFWPVTEDRVRTKLTGLGLVSVDEFKQRAASRGYLIDDLEAALPSPGDLGPPEVSTSGLLAPLP